jgi:hypothetical protein
VSATMSDRRRRAALVEKVDAGRLRASDPHGFTHGAPADALWGLGRSEKHRRQEARRRSKRTGGGPRSNPGATWVGVADGELGELPATRRS